MPNRVLILVKSAARNAKVALDYLILNAQTVRQDTFYIFQPVLKPARLNTLRMQQIIFASNVTARASLASAATRIIVSRVQQIYSYTKMPALKIV